MALAQHPHQEIEFQEFQRHDGQRFRITARIYVLPKEYDYWLTAYSAEHASWGHMRFTLIIPKSIAVDLPIARLYVGGAALQAVQAKLMTASESGRDLAVTFSHDGWVLT